jgi:hypothetical protein
MSKFTHDKPATVQDINVMCRALCDQHPDWVNPVRGPGQGCTYVPEDPSEHGCIAAEALKGQFGVTVEQLVAQDNRVAWSLCATLNVPMTREAAFQLTQWQSAADNYVGAAGEYQPKPWGELLTPT